VVGMKEGISMARRGAIAFAALEISRSIRGLLFECHDRYLALG
jgi:hypothetical protein